MPERAEKKNRLPLKWAVLAVSIASAATLSFLYAKALADSTRWRNLSDRAVVNPTFEARDPAKAKYIGKFSLKDRRGKLISLSQFSGVEVLVVNIWSTGCPGCEQELPSLMEMDRQLASLGQVALVTITIDDSWKDVSHLFPNGTDLRILFDPDETVTKEMFGTTRYPETFILDKQRRVRARFDGERMWHTREMMEYIASFNPG
jgi:peroxiredoxin